MAVMKNADINLLIKMENVIGMNEKKIFGRKGVFKYKERVYYKGGTSEDVETEVTKEDFVDYICLVQRMIDDKKDFTERVKEYQKANPDKMEKWRKKYEERRKNVKQ